ncbi:MAG: hypothetical protein KTR32_02295 [Granulosicoccus sp.]|nr:hypothetical protein [Granulosicoccus sp.]
MTSSTKTSDSQLKSKDKNDHDVIYTLRTAHQNQTQHLILADQKANVLIGIVAVTLTILLSRIDYVTTFFNGQEKLFRYGIGAFFIIETLALLMAIMVILPRTASILRSKKPEEMPNALHFGFFSQINEGDYVSYISNTITDNESARRLLAKDFYQMGKVLTRKYHYLKFAYSLTIAGFMVLLALIARWVFQLG